MNSYSPEANKAAAVFQQGMANVANARRTSEDALNAVVHSVYSDSTGHTPTAAPQNSHSTFDATNGHQPVKGF
jgi:hypothetical protein